MSKAAFAGLKAVQEIRFHLCQTSKGSEGVRNFLLKSYKAMKAASPTTPILIREASGVEGGFVARYGASPRKSRRRREPAADRGPARADPRSFPSSNDRSPVCSSPRPPSSDRV
tara:strand:- start:1672 stop:2013 length:342 start_codon:yes stop_codon:yes gene_type:complete